MGSGYGSNTRISIVQGLQQQAALDASATSHCLPRDIFCSASDTPSPAAAPLTALFTLVQKLFPSEKLRSSSSLFTNRPSTSLLFPGLRFLTPTLCRRRRIDDVVGSRDESLLAMSDREWNLRHQVSPNTLLAVVMIPAANGCDLMIRKRTTLSSKFQKLNRGNLHRYITCSHF